MLEPTGVFGNPSGPAVANFGISLMKVLRMVYVNAVGGAPIMPLLPGPLRGKL